MKRKKTNFVKKDCRLFCQRQSPLVAGNLKSALDVGGALEWVVVYRHEGVLIRVLCVRYRLCLVCLVFKALVHELPCIRDLSQSALTRARRCGSLTSSRAMTASRRISCKPRLAPLLLPRTDSNSRSSTPHTQHAGPIVCAHVPRRT